MRRAGRKFTRSAKAWVFILAVVAIAAMTSISMLVPMKRKPRPCLRPCPITSPRRRQYRLLLINSRGCHRPGPEVGAGKFRHIDPQAA